MKKTTKIIGAVLGVLLVAALFTGAVAAVDPLHLGTKYAYTPIIVDCGNVGTIWYLLDDQGKPTTTQIATVIGEDAYGKKCKYLDGLVEEGLYLFSNKIGTWTLRVKFPEIIAKAAIYKDDTFVGPLDGGFVPKSDGYEVKVTLVSPNRGVEWQLIDANGAATKLKTGVTAFTFDDKKVGEYVLVPYLNNVLVKGAPEGMEYGKPFSFTLGKADDEKVVLSAEKVNKGQTFVATVYGLPGVEYKVTAAPAGKVEVMEQKGVTPATSSTPAKFTMGASGVFDVSLKALDTGDDVTITVEGKNPKDATIEIIDGIITVEAEYDAYTIGDDIKLFGTSSGQDLFFYIEGVNVPFTALTGADEPLVDEEWERKFTYKEITDKLTGFAGLDAGTYIFYVSVEKPTKDIKKTDITGKSYVAVPVALKQSFISITDAPTAVAQGEKLVIEGTANAAKSVVWYLFGTNFFEVGSKNVKDDVFKITIDGKNTDTMAAGQYFFVVQHPMYDNKYSIAPTVLAGKALGISSFEIDGDIANNVVKYDTGAYEFTANGFTLVKEGSVAVKPVDIFSAGARQTPNAAEALCRALNSQNFDDMYAKASFIVGAPTSVINPIPAKIAQGEILKISGTTTGNKGDIVSVEFLATAFAAVPKEAVGTTAFVTVNTKVQDDGTWAIEFDTSNLNVDDYTVSVAVGSLGPATAKLTVVKAGEPVPTQTAGPQPTTAPTTAPTQTPASPGFGILAALAGLGAVAVLLLRRQ